jgi:hypothetical protein
MAYTILFTDPDQIRDVTTAREKWDNFLGMLAADGRFTAENVTFSETYQGLPARSPIPRIKIEVRKIRLTAKKPYCGNHPGPCEVPLFGGPRKKLNGRWLEWDDWVAFHGLLNDYLYTRGLKADVWSRPQDAKGKFWIRKDNRARTRFDYDEKMSSGFYPRTIRVWNLGTPDQFESEADHG